MKSRLDRLLVDRGMVQSRERAHALIMAGKVLVDEQKVSKPGIAVSLDAELRILGEDLRYVSRGGIKLEAALQHWHVEVGGRTCMDVGASTGGFTDCLLQHGAARVIAIDTGYGQLDFRLRRDPRVRLLEKTNARFLQLADVPEAIGIVAMDVAFISATLVLPAVLAAAFKESSTDLEERIVIVLVKPQFEAGREHVGKNGIVRDAQVQLNAVEKVRTCLRSLGAKQTDFIESPIVGKEGNREFLLEACF
ncbi:MAG: TlyA family RNA methyltransferase [Terriglobales bacterium]